MRSEFLGDLVNGAIPFLGGIYATLLGFRVIGKPPGLSEKYDAWHKRVGFLLKALGPALVLYGLFLWFWEGPSPNASQARLTKLEQDAVIEAALSLTESWKRYSTSDGICSAEFPQPPKHDKKTSFGVESDRLTLSPTGKDIYYMLTFTQEEGENAGQNVEQRLDQIREQMPAATAQMGQRFEFVREERIVVDGIPGRDLEFAAGDNQTVRTKVFIRGDNLYRLIAVTPRTQSADPATIRFLNSFRFETSGDGDGIR